MEVVKGHKHHTATAVLISTERVPRTLLIFHKKFNVWMPPGGHVEPHENEVEAVIREVLEETGVDISTFFQEPRRIDARGVELQRADYVREFKIDAHGNDPEHFHVDSLFVIRMPYMMPAAHASDPHVVRWFTKAEVRTVTTFENIRCVLDEQM